jgi:hypothetical protein
MFVAVMRLKKVITGTKLRPHKTTPPLLTLAGHVPQVREAGKAVMDKLPAHKVIGVVLVDNIPPQTTDSQLSHFFTEINGVTSIQYITGEGAGNHQRSCWIHVSNPAKTVTKINVSTIVGQTPRARLMGYLFTA